MQKHPTQCKSVFRFFNLFLFLISLNPGFISCTTTKSVLYFDNLPKDTTLHNLVTKDFELKIRKDDLINIGVSSLSVESSTFFTAPENSSGGTSPSAASGFLVDMNGNITLPKLGVLHVEGLTRDELKNLLLKELPPYLKEPIVTVNFVNHKVTVMGEVTNPQVLIMPGENMTLLQALVLCGGVSKTARKDNVLIIRENGADKQFKRINLNNGSIFYSPFYYLRPDDIIYIEPDTSKKGNVNVQQIIAYVSTGLSLLFLILSRIK